MALLEPPINPLQTLTLRCQNCKFWELLEDTDRQQSMELKGTWGKCTKGTNNTFIKDNLEEVTSPEKVIHFHEFYGTRLLYTRNDFACVNFQGRLT
jgi:hypothetical protein